MVDYNSLAEQIFSALDGQRLKITMFDINGAETSLPTKARRFFILDPNIMITIDEVQSETKSDRPRVVFNKGRSVDVSLSRLQKKIQNIAKDNLINFEIDTFGKTIEPKDFAYQAKMNKESVMENNIKPVNHLLAGQIMNMMRVWGGSISEADLTSNLGIMDLSDIRPTLNNLIRSGKIKAKQDKSGHPIYLIPVEPVEGIVMEKDLKKSLQESFSRMFGSRRTSIQMVENVRILIKHKVPISEETKGSRTRQIAEIFLESNGERFRFKENYLPGARAMARHLSFGGSMNDKVGSYITESTTQLLKLQSFNRYVINNQLINEDSSGIVETVKENIQTLKTELRKLTGTKTYETTRARLETFEKQQLSEDDVSQLKEIFTIKRFDEKFEEVLPIVKQLIQEKDTYHKRIEEAASRTIWIKKDAASPVPMFEFSSETAKIGYKLTELSMRIIENQELSEFIGKIGNKFTKESKINDFERAVLEQVFENIQIKLNYSPKTNIKESAQLEKFFTKYDNLFL
jgi:hypothetical protein